MPMTLDKFVAEAREALKSHPGLEGRIMVCDLVREALKDDTFVSTYINDKTPERQVLYEDPELGFTVLAHVYHDAKTSAPHDHGPTWAIYGQAEGETVMTDWECLARPTEATPGKAKRIKDYAMKPGDAYLYEPGILHSPRRDGPTRLLRIEGLNMDRVTRLSYLPVDAAA